MSRRLNHPQFRTRTTNHTPAPRPNETRTKNRKPWQTSDIRTTSTLLVEPKSLANPSKSALSSSARDIRRRLAAENTLGVTDPGAHPRFRVGIGVWHCALAAFSFIVASVASSGVADRLGRWQRGHSRRATAANWQLAESGEGGSGMWRGRRMGGGGG